MDKIVADAWHDIHIVMGVCEHVWVNDKECPHCRIEKLERLSTQRGARMQIMREWMVRHYIWDPLLRENIEASDWFDADGVPVREE